MVQVPVHSVGTIPYLVPVPGSVPGTYVVPGSLLYRYLPVPGTGTIILLVNRNTGKIFGVFPEDLPDNHHIILTSVEIIQLSDTSTTLERKW